MLGEYKTQHDTDENGNPAGGLTNGIGLSILWQNGPLGRHMEGCTDKMCARGCQRKRPNGAFVETVLAAAKDRLEYYQNSKFKSVFNEEAIHHIEKALESLNKRTADREARAAEGTHTV